MPLLGLLIPPAIFVLQATTHRPWFGTCLKCQSGQWRIRFWHTMLTEKLIICNGVQVNQTGYQLLIAISCKYVSCSCPLVFENRLRHGPYRLLTISSPQYESKVLLTCYSQSNLALYFLYWDGTLVQSCCFYKPHAMNLCLLQKYAQSNFFQIICSLHKESKCTVGNMVEKILVINNCLNRHLLDYQ